MKIFFTVLIFFGLTVSLTAFADISRSNVLVAGCTHEKVPTGEYVTFYRVGFESHVSLGVLKAGVYLPNHMFSMDDDDIEDIRLSVNPAAIENLVTTKKLAATPPFSGVTYNGHTFIVQLIPQDSSFLFELILEETAPVQRVAKLYNCLVPPN